MQATRAALAVGLLFLTGVAVSPSSSASSRMHVEFPSPANFAGAAGVEGTWVALLFGPDGSGNVALRTDAPFDVTNHTYPAYETERDGYVGFTSGWTERPLDSSSPSPPEVRLDFDGAWASLVVQARHVRLETESEGKLATWAAGQDMGMSPTELRANPLWQLHGQPAGEGVMARFDSLRHAPFQVRAEGLQSAVWFGANAVCDADPCPSGGGRHMTDLHLPNGVFAAAGSYSYEEAALTGGSLTGNGTLVGAVVLGPTLDLSVVGSIRLPLANGSGAACPSCLSPDGQTLHVVGSLELARVSAAPGGRMQAELRGDFAQARFDEVPIDSARLAGFTGAAAAAGAAVAWLLKPLLAPLFSRMTKEDAMDHPNRRKLYDAIQADPGISFREVARRAGLAAGTARHHLNVLCRLGLVQEERHRFTQRFFPASVRLDPAAVARGVLLREPQLARLHAVVEGNSWITQSDLIDLMAEEEGWTRSTTQHRLSRLVAGGLVQVRHQGRFQLHAVAGTVHPQDVRRPAQALASQYAMKPKPSSV